MDSKRAAVLASLASGEQSGRDLRRLLAYQGVNLSAPAFYQLMARMEEEGLVSVRLEPKDVEGVTIMERRYSH